MDSFATLVARHSAALLKRDDSSLSPGTVKLVIALMAVVIVGLLLTGALYFVRRIRKSRAVERQQLPRYNDKTPAHSHQRRLTITTSPYGRTSSIYIYDEKSSLTNNSAVPAMSADRGVPEIRLTFPDEEDECGRPKSGRVLLVRVGDRAIGLEPLNEEQLPAYEKASADQFHSIDMDRIGGLKEKSSWS